MTLEDLKQLMDSIVGPSFSGTITNDLSNKDSQRKSRIYLKNVECLREPRRETTDQQDNQINETFFPINTFQNNNCNSAMLNDDTAANNGFVVGLLDHNENVEKNTNELHIVNNKSAKKPKQKISIKSVDVLREPALLRRDYEIQSFSNFMNACGDLDLHAAVNSGTESFSYSPTATDGGRVVPLESAVITNQLEDNFDKQPRRPKIYIKNVDILKEPMVLAGTLNDGVMNYNFLPQNNYLNSTEGLTGSVQVFEGTLTQPPIGNISEQYLFENDNNNFVSNDNNSDNFSYTNAASSSGAFNNTRFSDDNLVTTAHHTSVTPLITEPTPPPTELSTESPLNNSHLSLAAQLNSQQHQESHQKQKIFIKNVDILKEPQFQEHRGTLHLRTVDELNLMNKNEVENLIAPNLENSQITSSLSELVENSHANFCTPTENTKQSKEVLRPVYSENNFKLQDFDAQVVNQWTDDYDLGDDIDCIITDTFAPMNSNDMAEASPKTTFDLDTPQMSLISIRDIEELTGGHNQLADNVFQQQKQQQNDVEYNTTDIHVSTDIIFSDVQTNDIRTDLSSDSRKDNTASTNEYDSSLKEELSHTIFTSIPTSINTPLTSLPFVQLNDISPHAPAAIAANTSPVISSASAANIVTSLASSLTTTTTSVSDTPITDIPLPPLVPVGPCPIETFSSTSIAKGSTSQIPPSEKGRIYVANNLMEAAVTKSIVAEIPIAVSVTGGTSVRGRPFGSNRTGITKMRKLYGNVSVNDVGVKCSMLGCAFRFKKLDTLEYHKRCHNSNAKSSQQSMICPECESVDFTNWNTLHTHLWRCHQVDMELYSCELCTFKTPVYSRLINTHSKIHYDDRNYKCDQCEKAFKNTKQLKNHRRWHRNHAAVVEGNSNVSSSPTLYRCKGCNAAFSHRKSLCEHTCKQGDAQKLQCDVCGRQVSSKSSLKLHMRTHEIAKRFQCSSCPYTANDHNAFRRHKMTHDNEKMYKCSYCSYKSIQSVAYQKHVQQKHPEVANSIIHKCTVCSFSTINRSLFVVHQAKHAVDLPVVSSTNTSEENDMSMNVVCPSATSISTDMGNEHANQKNKIKVKSDLILTDPSKLLSGIGNGLENQNVLVHAHVESALS